MVKVATGSITLTNLNDGTKGAAGVGVKNVIYYYQLSSNGTTPPPYKNVLTYEENGWSTTPDLVTPTLKYLWAFRKEIFTDNSSRIFDATVISAHGQKGDQGFPGVNGSDSHIHIKYANLKEDLAYTRLGISGYKGSVYSTTEENGSIVYTSTTAGTHPYKVLNTFNGTTKGGRGWLWVDVENLHPTDNLRIEFNGMGDTLNTTFTNPSVRPGERFTLLKPCYCRDTYDFTQVNMAAASVSGSVKYRQYHLNLLKTNPWIDFSDSEIGREYMGIYSDNNVEPSNDPVTYRWTKTKGDIGIPGKPGDDGRTPFLHTAWANSSNGLVDFSTSNSTNRRYLGTLVDYTEADSQDPLAYKWSERYGSTEMTGNLILNGNERWSSNNYLAKEYMLAEPLREGKTYTFVINWWRGDRDSQNFVPMVYYNGSTMQIISPDGTTNLQFSGGSVLRYDRVIDSWVATFTVLPRSEMNSTQLTEFSKTPPKLVIYRFGSNTKDQNDGHANTTAQSNASFATLVVGSIPMSSWQPNWTETKSEIDSKADQEMTLEQLNALAEQMEIQKAELEARASLETLNEWIVMYKKFVSDNEKEKKISEEEMRQLSQRVVAITNNLKDQSERWNFLDNYFTVAEEGLVFGKQDSSSAIKITDDRISMISAGEEVMYITQGVLQIKNGIFSISVQIGRFREEQHGTNKDMNVVRYVGDIM